MADPYVMPTYEPRCTNELYAVIDTTNDCMFNAWPFEPNARNQAKELNVRLGQPNRFQVQELSATSMFNRLERKTS